MISWKKLVLLTFTALKHPKTKQFTYESKPLRLKSRIDFFLISNSLISATKRCEIRPAIAPDHKAIFLGIKLKSETLRGPGTWKFNNSLLNDENYVILINFIYPQILEKYKEVEDKQLLWELMKMEIRCRTIKYSKNKRYELKKREITLQQSLQKLDHKLCNSENLQELLDNFAAAKEELKNIYDQKGKEAVYRSKARWVEQGEKPTKYFFNLEKRNYEKKSISQIKLNNGKITTDPQLIRKEIETFFSALYETKISDSSQSQQSETLQNFIESLDLPKLSNEEQAELEYDLSLEEVKNTLLSFENNKTPGEDGFTKEFYETFFDILCNDLLNSYKEAFHSGKLSISQRRGIISLIPKSDSDLTEMSSWRPITLLNIDYKILTKIIAKRIQTFLPKLIHSDQTGFVKGRYIGQNVRLLSGLMEYTSIEKLPGVLLFVDFEKAFDSLEWNLISKVLELFNFGPVIRKWFSVIYNDVESAAINTGFLTNYFKVSRGVRQGCPLSPFLFILAVEILACKIRKDPGGQGVFLPNGQEVKLSQFADDTTLIARDAASLTCLAISRVSN